MIVLILLREELLNFGHGKLRKVMEKVMESHGILIKSTYPAARSLEIMHCKCTEIEGGFKTKILKKRMNALCTLECLERWREGILWVGAI